VSRILVVDDHEDIRLLLRLELSADGHHIVEAENGEEALAAIAAGPVDLVLLDIMMPVMDGWEVLRRLSGEPRPPIVVVTGMSSAEHRHVVDLLELGALDVVPKPFEPDWLLRLVDAILLVDPDEHDEYRQRRIDLARNGA
jgi:DNA-binding response OmpR family regulator